MCVVERKTYIHSDGRREVVEKHRRCHNAPKNGLCPYVEHRNDTARVIEMRPSSSRGSTPDGELITTGRDGRPRRYQTVNRKSSLKNSSGRTSRAGERSPADSMSPPAPLHPLYQEVKPPAPTPPTVAGGYPSARRSATLSPTLPPDPNVRVGPGGTAVYDRPPSLEMPRAEINERPQRSRPSSFSSTSADIDDPESPSPPRRRVSFRQRRPSNVVIDVDAASANIPASGFRSSPGLGNLPNPFAETIPSRGSKGKTRSRVDSAADEAARRQQQQQQQQQQEEDDRQARLENEKLAEAERRQRARIRKADEAAAEARERAAEIERERADSSRERRERERRRTAAALEGNQRARQDAEIERKVNAELAQVAREKAEAEARREQQYQPIRPSTATMSPRNSSGYNTNQLGPSSSSPTSARRMTPTTTTTISARGPLPPYPITIHNYPSNTTSTPSARKNSLSERGEAVIAREQARAAAAAERINDAMAGMQLDEGDDDDDEDDDELDAEMRRTASRRTRKEGKDREREQRKERERRLRDEGYF